MKNRKSVISRPLDLVLSAPSHIAILRALKDVKEGLSGREVARRAGINHQTCAEALARLESRGIVTRIGSGYTQLFRLNRENNLFQTVIGPMLKAEREQFLLMQEDLARVVEGHCLSGVLFGSVARKEDTPESDLDVALIVERKTQKLPEVIQALVIRGMEKWGVRVSPIILTRAEFSRRANKKDPLVSDIVREGIVVYGKHPRGLVK